MVISTKNFHPDTDPKLICTCGHPSCDKRSVKQHVLGMAQIVRFSLGRSMVVTSGGRCPHHPNEIHRDIPADHQKCHAIDIACNSSVERGELISAGIKAGFNAIGVAKTFVHLGYREDWDSDFPLMWIY